MNSPRPLALTIGTILGSLVSVAVVSAWTAPTGAPPTANVSAPINVGNVNQVKSSNLAVNGLAVFGDTLLQASSYLNWGATAGTTGYGVRDNAGIIEFKNSAGSWAGIGSAGSGPWTTSGTSIYNNNAGNVGIGTTSPGAKLDVAGSILSSANLNTAGRGATDWYNINTGSIGAWGSIYSYGSICSGNNNGNCSGANGVVLGITNSAAKVNIPNTGNVLFNGGNVGVGTLTAANGTLDVETAVASKTGIYGLSSSGLGVYGVSTSNIGTRGTSNSSIGVYGDSSSNIGVYGISGTSVGVEGISSGANYGVYGQSAGTHGVVGLTNADGVAGVLGYSANTGSGFWYTYGMLGLVSGGQGYAVYGNATQYTGGIGGYFVSNSSGTGVRAVANGDYGVYGTYNGSSSGFTPAGVYGNTATAAANGVRGVNTAASGYGVYCQAASCGGNKVWTNASDVRLKTDIKTLSAENGLESILKLRPVTYKWKDASDYKNLGEQYGFIAQEVESVLPAVVTTNDADAEIRHEDGSVEKIAHPKAMSYATIVVPLVKAVQQLKAENDSLKLENLSLEKRIEKLEQLFQK